MGNRTSSFFVRRDPDGSKSKAIDKQIIKDKKRLKGEAKILLLGAGESGKSTVSRQMRLIHTCGFDADEKESFRTTVFSNVIEAMQVLIDALEKFNVGLENESLTAHISLIQSAIPDLTPGQPYPQLYLEPLKELWNDSGIQKICQMGNQFALHDNIQYYYEQLDTLWKPTYVPSEQDIVRCRVKTIGIVETTVYMGALTYQIVDVGGQRSERRKWIHCFEDITAIIFVVAMSGYDKCMIEDWNSMIDAMMLFENISNSHWFQKTSMILLMNKVDIFRKKIKYSPIATYFDDYKGGDDYDKAITYFKSRFEWLSANPRKTIYTHCTDATDRTILQRVMSAVLDIIMTENVNNLML
ncbi:putative guanine nucleotide-binding protein alpha-2 subunit [Zychaea mexicana]|uniref:putative guanine nucleotide-binding protein alpha-2 subunit n=1 Tax=Zychaea mexicana TaxID=64656 RepID=UPI0022FE27F3|nr:putative guanine nucleotide-binding protein alpha-2 subunit [Zychaea mexicana]KAI9493788.1 putative guanine nucleotide-binding protein alpha-2 subunit [Zychaea mexicana]